MPVFPAQIEAGGRALPGPLLLNRRRPQQLRLGDRGRERDREKPLIPAHDASGLAEIWLDGAFCGAYQGPTADRDDDARRHGVPFINAQPRFGIYHDWRAETHTIYFDKIMFWNADPAGHPDWSMSPPRDELPMRSRPGSGNA
jgi:hypothetical protein